MAMRPVYINGKVYAGPPTGVRRVADRLVRELDAQLGAAGGPPATLLLPARYAGDRPPALSAIRVRALDVAPSQGWEQFRLPMLAADGVLVNLANLAPWRHRRKLVLIHDAQFAFPDCSYPPRQRLGYRLLMPHIARSSATVLTVSAYSQRMLEVMGVSPAARTGVLPNGVDHVLETPPDPRALAELGLAPRGYALLFGSAKAYKNNAVVFAAYRRGALAAVPLVVVGATRAGLVAQGLDPPAGTVFAGACDDGRLRALYAGARCLLCPSRTEGFGLPPLEAMACGTPAVVAPAGALPETCRDAVLYADVDDPAAWEQAILALVPGSPLFARKVAEGRARAAQFPWARAGAQLFAAILALSAP